MRQRRHKDTTWDRVNRSGVGRVFATITDRRQVGVVVLAVVWGLSWQEISRRMGISEREAGILLNKTVSRFRHPSLVETIHEDLLDDVPARSPELRSWAQEAAEAMLVTCTCGRRFLPENMFSLNGGRPPKYCSNACRQAAYRARRRNRDVPQS